MPKPVHDGPHKYERIDVGTKGHVIYRCMLPDCPHFLPSITYVTGRLSLCWGCDDTCRITKEDIWHKVKHPMCESCKEERAQRREEMKQIL